MNHLISPTLFYYLFIISGLITAGCGNSVDSVEELNVAENWQLQAFEGENVTFLEADGDGLLIGTGEGLFQLKDGQFFNLGLNKYEMRGAVRLKGNDLLAAVRTPDFSSGDVTIFKRRDGRNSWEPFLNDYGGEGNFTFIFSLKSVNPMSDTLFAKGSGGTTAMSINGGKNWTLVTGQWDSFGGVGTFTKSDPHRPGHIWAGGVGPFSMPYLIISKNFGKKDTWLGTNIDVINGVITESIVYDVETNINGKNKILAGLSGSIRLTTDGGESWQISLGETGVLGFARSITKPEVIYAGGRDTSRKLFFAATNDFGENWEKEIFVEGPIGVTTNDLEVLMIDGKEILFLATDQGLYSFTFSD